MIIDRVDTARLVAKRFGSHKDFNKVEVLSLCEEELITKPFYTTELCHEANVEIARRVIKRVFEEAILIQDTGEKTSLSVAGIVQGVGGHIVYQPLLDAVTRLVNNERKRRGRMR